MIVKRNNTDLNEERNLRHLAQTMTIKQSENHRHEIDNAIVLQQHKESETTVRKEYACFVISFVKIRTVRLFLTKDR
jgi:hypothetical protein